MKGVTDTKVEKVSIFLFFLNPSFSYLNTLFSLCQLFFEKQKEEKGRKSKKGRIRRNKEIPTFLMHA
jgi:hypothetical protein